MFYDKELVADKLRKWEKHLIEFTLPKWDELPKIKLYMDQVVALLLEYMDFLPNNENEEKVVTPAAINNYVRNGVMPPPHKKKYSRIHIAYLIMICTLKRSISISYVKKMIPTGLDEEDVKRIYEDYVERHRAVSLCFVEQVRTAAEPMLDPEASSENAVDNLVTSAAVISGFSRLLTEKIIRLQTADNIPENEKSKKKEQRAPG